MLSFVDFIFLYLFCNLDRSTLKTESSSVERSGAAQGLSEVCHSLGPKRMRDVLQQVLPWNASKFAGAREGLMWLLSFLPTVDDFSDEISTTLPVILIGLSDTSEGVREVALRSAQVLVSSQGKQNFDTIIPSLVNGMSENDWRIRQNSVMLLGELLYLIADTKAVGIVDAVGDNEDEDVNFAGSSNNSGVLVTIRSIIGDSTTNEILACLYLTRCDMGSSVRQIALQVWKSIVSNTPRTLVEVMPVLVDIIVRKLSEDETEGEQRAVAAKCLGEIVRKLGDKVLPIVIPHLRKGLESEESMVRRGVCVGLSEILSASSRIQIDTYLSTLIPALREALCDVTSSEVRLQAASAFQTLLKNMGPSALDHILPSLMSRLADSGCTDAGALLGIQEIVTARPREVLEHLLPIVLASPMSTINAKVLTAMSASSGANYNYHFQDFIPQICRELISSAKRDESSIDSLATHEQVKEAATAVMGATTTSGVNFLVVEIGKQVEKSTPSNLANEVLNTKWSIWLLGQFLTKSNTDYEEYIQIILKILLTHSADSDSGVLEVRCHFIYV